MLGIKDIHSLSIVYKRKDSEQPTDLSIELRLICFTHTLENYKAVQRNKIAICTDMLRSLDVLDEKYNLQTQIVYNIYEKHTPAYILKCVNS